MSSIIFLKLNVKYLDSGSILKDLSEYTTYYLPESDISFKKSTWNQDQIKKFNDTFTELDDEIYLVKNQVVCVRGVNSILVDNSYDDVDIEDFYFTENIWDDIKDTMPKFNEIGISEKTFVVVLKETWTQSWEGDWDVYQEYIGTLGDKFNIQDSEFSMRFIKSNLKVLE